LNNDSGDAELSIPISGPRGKGRILVAAKKEHGRWSYQTMEVDVDGDDTAIPLLNPGEGAPAPKDNPSGIT
jgi:Cytochrome oxidase complex assembly protein 1